MSILHSANFAASETDLELPSSDANIVQVSFPGVERIGLSPPFKAASLSRPNEGVRVYQLHCLYSPFHLSSLELAKFPNFTVYIPSVFFMSPEL